MATVYIRETHNDVTKEWQWEIVSGNIVLDIYHDETNAVESVRHRCPDQEHVDVVKRLYLK